MPSDLETYRQTLIDLYLRLPDTPAPSEPLRPASGPSTLGAPDSPDDRGNSLLVSLIPPRGSSPRRHAPRTYSLPTLLPARDRRTARPAGPRVLSCLPAQQSPPPLRNRQDRHHHGLTFNPTRKTGLCSNFYVFKCAPTCLRQVGLFVLGKHVQQKHGNVFTTVIGLCFDNGLHGRSIR